MQCPECGHTPAVGEQVDPTRCPECGIYYHKALAARVRELEADKQRPKASAEQPAVAQPQQKVVRNASAMYPGAQPVVVLDVNMSFGSMVIFMIKWGLAAIPALIILTVIFFFIGSFLSGLFVGHPGS